MFKPGSHLCCKSVSYINITFGKQRGNVLFYSIIDWVTKIACEDPFIVAKVILTAEPDRAQTTEFSFQVGLRIEINACRFCVKIFEKWDVTMIYILQFVLHLIVVI